MSDTNIAVDQETRELAVTVEYKMALFEPLCTTVPVVVFDLLTLAVFLLIPVYPRGIRREINVVCGTEYCFVGD